MKITLTRSSVAAGDDAFAPHEKTIDVPDTATVEDVMKMVKDRHYLANIYSGKATWVAVHLNYPLAVMAQQWSQPKYFIDPSTILQDIFTLSNEHFLHFEYHQQKDPNEVYQSLFKKNSPSEDETL